MEVWIVSDDSTIQLEADETPFFADSFDGFEIELNARKSRHSISKDNNKSDHISLEPMGFTLDGCIASQAFSKGVDLFQGGGSRTEAACDLLIEMWRSKRCATLVIKGKRFEDMALISAPIRCSVDGRLSFNLRYEQFEFYDVSEVFEATIGRRIDLGEVNAPTGTPSTPPTSFAGAFDFETIGDAIDAAGGTSAFIECDTCELASNTSCLDACYGGI